MPQISLRACEMPESPIRKLFPLAEAAKARGVVVTLDEPVIRQRVATVRETLSHLGE